MAHKVSVVLHVPPEARHTSHPATAMQMYRIVQAGGNTQLGGFHDGFRRAACHPPGLNRMPERAAANVNTRKTGRDVMLNSRLIRH